MKHILALDQGTTSSRAIVFDHAGSIVSVAQQEFRQIFPKPGWVEHDANEIWATQSNVAAEAILKARLTANDIAAIGITNQRETTVVWERDTGKPIANAIVWQDRRTAAVCDKLKRDATDDDLFSHLMYPEVFADFAKIQRDFGEVSALPTPAFFYGLKPDEEISVSIEQGKTLFIKLVNIGTPDKDGRRTVTFELNGMTRETSIPDKSVAVKTKARAKADPANPLEVAAPIPGIITALAVGVGAKVAKDDKLVTMEAMKMQTTIYAQADGVVAEISAQVGETVESKDLLMKLKA